MKKYSADYFEKKYKILFNKLLLKQGFLDDIKETRRELGLPENGYNNEADLAIYFISKMNKKEQQILSYIAFADNYYRKNNLPINDENRKKMVQAYAKESRKDIGSKTIFWFGQEILDHTKMFTKNVLFQKNKFLSKLFPKTIKLIRKFWWLDLLDEHIMGHFVERYLFLGENGVNQYIKARITCPMCRYIGVDHFSPDRGDMQGQDEGPYGKNYIFNKKTVRLLSLHFNSVFLIIKPYATKEEVLQYIEDNWNNLKEHIIEKNAFYKQFDIHPSKIKENDFERNNLIYELYKLPKKELIKMYKGERDLSGAGIYKEMVISAILNEEHGIEMTPDAIKKTATRFVKSIKTERPPKDIEDI
jgi:hypothetical protein